MEADELHYLRGEFLAKIRAIADTDVVHQICETHDTEPDPARSMSRFHQLGHRWYI